MLSHADLVDRFVKGAEKGKASRMEIEKLENGNTAIIGYGWAVYAERDGDGVITRYDGWSGYSPTTTAHLSMIPADRISWQSPRIGIMGVKYGEELSVEHNDVRVEYGSGVMVKAVIKIDGSLRYILDGLDAERLIVKVQEDPSLLEFVKEVARNRLDLEKHLDFDWEKLAKAKKISCSQKKAIEEYKRALDGLMNGNKGRVVGFDDFIFMMERQPSSVRVIAFSRAIDNYYYIRAGEVSVGKMIKQGKITPTIKKKMKEKENKPKPPVSNLLSMVKKCPDVDRNKLPEWVKVSLVEEQLKS